jgi:hypothetical protein
MKFMLTLFACLVALATAAPALAGNGQSVSESVGAVQASSTSVNPAVSVVAPVGVSAPVCVASACSTSQPAAPVSSGSSTTGGRQSRTARQKASHSAGVVQVGTTNVSPALSAAAPVGASAPVCVASRCSSGQSSGQAGAGASTTNGGQSRPSGQRVSQSVGAVQVDSTTVSPAASVAAPIGVFVPVWAASGCSVSQSQISGLADVADIECGSERDRRKVLTEQVGQVGRSARRRARRGEGLRRESPGQRRVRSRRPASAQPVDHGGRPGRGRAPRRSLERLCLLGCVGKAQRQSDHRRARVFGRIVADPPARDRLRAARLLEPLPVGQIGSEVVEGLIVSDTEQPRLTARLLGLRSE